MTLENVLAWTTNRVRWIFKKFFFLNKICFIPKTLYQTLLKKSVEKL